MRCIFHQFSGLLILVFSSSWLRFSFSAGNLMTSLKSVLCVILSMTFFNVSATPGIATTKICLWADISAGCRWGGVARISHRWWGTEFNPWSRYHSGCSPTMLGTSLCTKLTHCWLVFPHKMDSGIPITTFSITNLESISAATAVKVLPIPIWSAISNPGTSASQTRLLTINPVAQTWCSRKFVPGRPGINYLWPGTQLSVEWQKGWTFSSLTTSLRHSCSNWLLIVLKTVLNSETVLSGSRIFLPSTFWRTSVAPWSVFNSSSMITFMCSDLCWAYGLMLWQFWNLSQQYVFYKEAFGSNNMSNIINSIHSISTPLTNIIQYPNVLPIQYIGETFGATVTAIYYSCY